mgnify:CR=1 FL=1
MTMRFDETDAFAKQFRRLSRKYRSLPDDLHEFKKVITVLPLGSGKHFAVLHGAERITIVKARLFCRYLKGATLRIIYAYRLEETAIDFIEIYFKGEQERESRNLIRDFLRGVER